MLRLVLKYLSFKKNTFLFVKLRYEKVQTSLNKCLRRRCNFILILSLIFLARIKKRIQSYNFFLSSLGASLEEEKLSRSVQEVAGGGLLRMTLVLEIAPKIGLNRTRTPAMTSEVKTKFLPASPPGHHRV